jgi:hypothetical protein
MSCTTPSAACPCGTVTFPQVICNSPNLSALPYRIGDYLAFRHNLLQALPGETELVTWRPGATGDLAAQMMEWCAYVLDVLSFYNERIANEQYLGTALLPESVNHLVQLLGYRPRPALGSTGTLAGLLSPGARLPVALPAGLQVQSKPGPGQPPQVFELTAAASLTAPDVVAAVVPVIAPLVGSNSDGSSYLWLSGKVSGIKQGDRLLLINAVALTAQKIQDYAWIMVSGTATQSDPLGNPVTQVNFTTVGGSVDAGGTAASYLLLRSVQSSPLWSYPTTSNIINTSGTPVTVDLGAITRAVTPGSLLLLDTSAPGLTPTPVIVQQYAEVVWYANCGANQPATQPPLDSPPGSVPPIAIPHSEISIAALSSGSAWSTQGVAAQVTARFGWTPVGQLAPALTAGDLAYSGGNTTLVPASGAAAFPTTASAVLLEDPTGNAAAGSTSVPDSSGAITLTFGQPSDLPAAGLASPVSVMFDLLPVTRGKTVATEVLGSGNPAVAGQDFALSQSPVTYFADPASISGDGFSSTVKVSINGVQWQEQQSFYGQPPTAQIFVLREDDAAQTHVTFGDGINGARLPTGTNNITATYRFGAGATAPMSETLTVVITPQPGLKGVLNPMPPTGGSDADAPSKLRSLAPQSVLTFNRAVSLDDYAAIAATASGVTQVAAGFVFDTQAQRPMVTLWVAGDNGSVAAVQTALAGAAVPNQPLNVMEATAIVAALSLTYVRDPNYADAAVQAGLTTALVDPSVGLLGVANLGIGQAIYDSQIAAACLAVPGVLAIHDVTFTDETGGFFFPIIVFRSRLPRFRGVPAAAPGCTGNRFDPGNGRYFSVPNDGQHLTLSAAVAS